MSAMRYVLLLTLALLAAPLAAQPSADLLARFDAAMNQPPEHNRASLEGGALVIRSTSCATTIPIRAGTTIETITGGVNPFAIRIRSAGIHIGCTSFQDDTDIVHYRFDNAAARDASVRAGQALFAGWTGGAAMPASVDLEPEPVPEGGVVQRCVSGDCTDGTGAVEYFEDGVVLLRYTGPFRDGLPHGQGRYTDADGDAFEGTLAEGYEVRGRMTYADGDVYDGEWQHSRYHGQGRYTFGPGDFEGDVLDGTFADGDPVTGTYTWTDGRVYTGEWNGWNRHGQGTMTYTNGNRYEGQWARGNRHGRGTFTWPSGATFTGDWVEDGRVRGTEHYTSGSVYEGEYADDKRHGRGTMTYADGSVYEGAWAADEKHGQGRYTWGAGDFEGDVYEGTYLNGERTGQGTYTWTSGMVYTGEWLDGQRQGEGTMTWPSGQRYVGEWHAGERSGQGAQTYADGRLFQGIWAEDGPIQGTLQQPGAEPRPVSVVAGQFVYTD